MIVFDLVLRKKGRPDTATTALKEVPDHIARTIFAGLLMERTDESAVEARLPHWMAVTKNRLKEPGRIAPPGERDRLGKPFEPRQLGPAVCIDHAIRKELFTRTELHAPAGKILIAQDAFNWHPLLPDHPRVFEDANPKVLLDISQTEITKADFFEWDKSCFGHPEAILDFRRTFSDITQLHPRRLPERLIPEFTQK
jgi:hypothetical protein